MMTDNNSYAVSAALAVLTASLAGCGGGGDPSAALRSFACVASADIEVVCGFQNPEDLVRYGGGGGGWLLISQMGGGDFASEAGSLVAWQPSSGSRQPLWPPAGGAADYTLADGERWGDASCPPPKQFSPHGIDLGARAGVGLALLAVNHRAEGLDSIDFFELRTLAGNPQLDWRGCVLAPPGAVMNDVVVAEDGFIASRMYTVPMPAWRGFFMAMGLDTGSVHEWQPASGWRDIPNSEGALPNGLALSPDGQALFIHQYFDRLLLKLDRHSGALLGSAPVVRGDNLSWAPDGSLLSASHPAGLEEMGFCHSLEGGVCLSDMLIQRIDPDSLRVTASFHHRGEPFGMATVAVESDGAIYVGSFRADRLAHFPTGRLRAVAP